MGCTQTKQANITKKYRNKNAHDEEFKKQYAKRQSIEHKKIPISLLKTQSNCINDEDIYIEKDNIIEEDIRTASCSQGSRNSLWLSKEKLSLIYQNYDYLPQDCQKLINQYQKLNYNNSTDLFPLHEEIKSFTDKKKIQLKINNNSLLKRRNIKLPKQIQYMPNLQPLQNSLEHNQRDMSVKKQIIQ